MPLVSTVDDVMAESCHHLAVSEIGHVEGGPGQTNVSEFELGLGGDGRCSEILLARTHR